MALVYLFGFLAFFVEVEVVSGAYSCSGSWTVKTGSPKCAGPAANSCSDSTCCSFSTQGASGTTGTTGKTCSHFSAAWVGAQLLSQGCAVDTKFFDTKKLTTAVASPQGDSEVKAACCTPFSQAKCSDWAAMLGVCPTGKVFVSTNSAPADNGGKTLARANYHSKCCVTPPKTCQTYSALWLGAQLLQQGCAVDNKFFDTKKMATTVGGSQSDDDIKRACCTPFSAAKCSDWAAMLGVCPSGTGKVFVPTNDAPADNNGKTLAKDNYHSKCCELPMECSAWTNVNSCMSKTAVSVLALLSVIIAMVIV